MRGLWENLPSPRGSHLTSYQSDAAHAPRRAPRGQRWDSFLEELEIKKRYLKPCQLILQRVRDGSLQHYTDIRYLPCLFRAQFQDPRSCPPQGPPLYSHSPSSFLNELQGWFPACLNRTSLTQPALGWNHQLGLPSVWKTNPSAGLSSRKRTRILKRRRASAKFPWTAAWVKLMFAVYLA